MEDEPIVNREQRGVGGDADGECENGHEREARRVRKRTKPGPEVGHGAADVHAMCHEEAPRRTLGLETQAELRHIVMSKGDTPESRIWEPGSGVYFLVASQPEPPQGGMLMLPVA